MDLKSQDVRYDVGQGEAVRVKVSVTLIGPLMALFVHSTDIFW